MEIMQKLELYTALWRETNMIYEDWAKKHGLSYSELLVILSLAEMKGTCLQKDICRQWTLPKQTVNSVLKNLMERSLVSLTSYETDRRSKLIQLTKEGKLYVDSIAGDLQRAEYSAWTKMGEENTDMLLKTVSLYNSYLKEEVESERK